MKYYDIKQICVFYEHYYSHSATVVMTSCWLASWLVAVVRRLVQMLHHAQVKADAELMICLMPNIFLAHLLSYVVSS